LRGACLPTAAQCAGGSGRSGVERRCAAAGSGPARDAPRPRARPRPRSVVIKGGAGDDAVLCTNDKTYALKYVETTNLLLLLPPDEVGRRGPAGAGCRRGAEATAPARPRPRRRRAGCRHTPRPCGGARFLFAAQRAGRLPHRRGTPSSGRSTA
jgi:hypothetical protein